MDERLLLRCPRGCEGLWDAFIRLGRARPSSGLGASGIPFGEIEAWQRLTGAVLTAWELDTLLELDAHVLARSGKKERKS